MVDLVTYRFRVGNYTQKQFNFRSGCSSMTGSDKNSRAFTLMCILAIGMLVNKSSQRLYTVLLVFEYL